MPECKSNQVHGFLRNISSQKATFRFIFRSRVVVGRLLEEGSRALISRAQAHNPLRSSNVDGPEELLTLPHPRRSSYKDTAPVALP